MKKEPENLAVKVVGLSKTFRIPHEKSSSLKSSAINLLLGRKSKVEIFKATNDVSFEIKKGEFFGIIGKNGSGKSTLLKMLAGIYIPDCGNIEINGKLSPFLELGVGFNPELTGRENLFLGGTILGLTRKEIQEKFDKIVSFAELEEFIDMKLKNYSSGMQVRLAFSLAINAHAEILLMDEVLAVGDSNFQAKCIEEFIRYKRQGKTVVLVTHDLSTVERYCDRALYLESGRVIDIGKPSFIVGEYMEKNITDKNKTKSEKKESFDRIIKKVVFLNKSGEEKNAFQDNEPITARIYFNRKKLKLANPINFGVALHNISDDYCFGTNTIIENIDTSEFMTNGYFELTYENHGLLSGQYYVKAGVFGESDSIIYDFMPNSKSFTISSALKQQGLIFINHHWS